MKSFILAAAVTGLFLGEAIADPAVNWTGFYAGANLGAGWNATEQRTGVQNHTGLGNDGAPQGTAGFTTAWVTDFGSRAGFTGGLTAGYNHQISPILVLGIETDFQFADFRGDGNATTNVPPLVNNIVAHNGSIAASQSVDWFGTVRGRIGITSPVPSYMFYATGGLAYGYTKSRFSMFDSFPSRGALFAGASAANSVDVGWTAGAGVEWAMTSKWSVKGEWLYVDLGERNLNGLNNILISGPAPFPVFATSQSYRYDFNVMRFGLNYRL